MLKQKFNQDWFFLRSGGGALAALMGQGMVPVPVTLPHDASVLRVRNPEEPGGSGNGYFREENYTYTKEFTLDLADRDRVVWMEFEGVYQNSAVYVNNAFAGNRPYGYTNFYLDITRFVRFGESNQIQVIVKNGVPSGRWYTGGGIYRDVNLMVADRLHLIPDGIHVTAMDIEPDSAVIRVESVVEYNGCGNQDVRLVTELLNPAGEIVASQEMPITVFEQSKKTYRQQLVVPNPTLWDLDSPALYTYRTMLKTAEGVRDSETGTFGIRKLQLDVKHGFRLNGNVVKMRGGCVHHDDGILGSAVFAHATERKVRKLKEAGYNAIRSSHYPMNRRMLDACDKVGMLVMDELSDVWTTTKVDFDYGMHFAQWWERDITEMVNKDYNHPCVVMYSIGNEIPQTGNKFDNDWGKKLADKLRALDHTRFTTNSLNLMLSVMDRMDEVKAAYLKDAVDAGGDATEINEMMNDHMEMMGLIVGCDIVSDATEESFAQVDIAGYNYAAIRYEPDGDQYPNRVIVGSETFPADLDYNWERVEKLPYLIGDFSWTAWEYLGEAGIGKWNYGPEADRTFYGLYPWKMGYCGDFNLIGQRRPVSYWREIIWGLRKDPYIAVRPPMHYGEDCHHSVWGFTDAIHCWNWSSYEGKGIVVEVYADADEVELLLDGTSLGKQATGVTKKAITFFDTVYHPGKLEAIAWKNGVELGRQTLCTAGDAVELQVVADRTCMQAGGSDLCFVEISLLDADGNLNMELDKPVQVTVEGAGVLQGFGSADPLSEENYFDHTAKAFEGRVMAAVRSTAEPGEVRVQVTAEGCHPVTVRIESK